MAVMMIWSDRKLSRRRRTLVLPILLWYVIGMYPTNKLSSIKSSVMVVVKENPVDKEDRRFKTGRRSKMRKPLLISGILRPQVYSAKKRKMERSALFMSEES